MKIAARISAMWDKERADCHARVDARKCPIVGCEQVGAHAHNTDGPTYLFVWNSTRIEIGRSDWFDPASPMTHRTSMMPSSTGREE